MKNTSIVIDYLRVTSKRSFVRNHAIIIESKLLRITVYIALQILCSDWSRFNGKNAGSYILAMESDRRCRTINPSPPNCA